MIVEVLHQLSSANRECLRFSLVVKLHPSRLARKDWNEEKLGERHSRIVLRVVEDGDSVTCLSMVDIEGFLFYERCLQISSR